MKCEEGVDTGASRIEHTASEQCSASDKAVRSKEKPAVKNKNPALTTKEPPCGGSLCFH